MKRKTLRILIFAVVLLPLLAALGGWLYLQNGIKPLAKGEPVTVRFDQGQGLGAVLEELEKKGVLRSAELARLALRIQGKSLTVGEGTYRFRPGMTLDEILMSLKRPVAQPVRLPEGWWIRRTARRLEEMGVCKAEEYIELANQPEKFAGVVDFPLPKESLEGYLFPDTYDLPPLLGARGTIVRQLKNFERRVWPKVKGRDVHRLLTIASMVETEVKVDAERPLVAGLIEERLRRRMRLQIDATVLYALQEWKNLGPGVVNTVDHPYNTYRISGLPPGPIGSPGLKSIEAALKPTPTRKLFYVAKPDGTHFFSETYDQHLVNIRRARSMAR